MLGCAERTNRQRLTRYHDPVTREIAMETTNSRTNASVRILTTAAMTAAARHERLPHESNLSTASGGTVPRGTLGMLDQPGEDDGPDFQPGRAARDEPPVPVVLGEAGGPAADEEPLVPAAQRVVEPLAPAHGRDEPVPGAGQAERGHVDVPQRLDVVEAVAAEPAPAPVPAEPLVHHAPALVLGTETERRAGEIAQHVVHGGEGDELRPRAQPGAGFGRLARQRDETLHSLASLGGPGQVHEEHETAAAVADERHVRPARVASHRLERRRHVEVRQTLKVRLARSGGALAVPAQLDDPAFEAVIGQERGELSADL